MWWYWKVCCTNAKKNCRVGLVPPTKVPKGRYLSSEVSPFGSRISALNLLMQMLGPSIFMKINSDNSP